MIRFRMVVSYRDKRTRHFAAVGRVKAFSGIERAARLKLDRLEAAVWRICFEWPQGGRGPVNVEIVDYHQEARHRQWQLEKGNRLSGAAPRAHRDDLPAFREVDGLDRHLDAEDLGLERQREVFLQHRGEAHALLGIVVGIDRRLRDEEVEPGVAAGT